MTRAMNISFAVSAILGLAAGGGFGYYQGTEVSETIHSLEPMSAGSVLSDYAARQFRYADLGHARQAVQLEISVLEQLSGATHDTLVEGKLGLAYIRLAMVEEAADNKDAERLALNQARAWLPHRPGKKVSDEQLKDFLKKLDQAEIGTASAPKTTNDANIPPHASLE